MKKKFHYMNDFRVGDYAVIVSHMFDGTEGTIYEVDQKKERITLSAGIECGFDSAWNLTLRPDHRKDSYFSNSKWRFRHKKFIKSIDAYLEPWERELLRFFRRIISIIKKEE